MQDIRTFRTRASAPKHQFLQTGTAASTKATWLPANSRLYSRPDGSETPSVGLSVFSARTVVSHTRGTGDSRLRDGTAKASSMAHKKGQGSTKNGRDSNPQYRGVKLYAGETAQPGSILVRQLGTVFHPGFQVKRAKDDTLFAVGHGKVVFTGRKVNVVPTDPKIAKPFWL